MALERQQRLLIIEQARLAALQAKEYQPSEADLNALAQKLLLEDQNLSIEKGELSKQREATVLQLQGLAPNHPGRPVLERQIIDIDRESTLIDGKAMDRSRSILLGTRSAQAHDEIEEAQTRVDQEQRARDGIEGEVAELKTSVASFGTKYNQAMALNDQLESHIKALSEIEDRVDLLRLESQSPGVASLELPAQLPDKPEGGKRKEILALSVLLAVLLATAVPMIVDLSDTRIRTPRELERVLGMPVLGSTPSTAAKSDRETVRRIALGIIRERRRAGTRVFVITAVGRMAGTSSLTLALSSELTELGVSAIAVEANAVYPDPRYQEQIVNWSDHSEAAVSGTPHLAGNSRTDLVLAPGNKSDVCEHSIISASDLLPDRISVCGSQKHQRLTMGCVQKLLEIALSSHDIVLVDTLPVLGSADTAMLVQNPAGVIVVVRADRDRLHDVKAAIYEVNKLSPPVVGVVMHRVRHDYFAPALHDLEEHGNLRLSRSKQRAEMSLYDGSSKETAHYS